MNLNVVYTRLDELLLAPRNPKEHDMPMLHNLMDSYGFTEPVLVDERTGRLVAGHGRLQTLKEKMDQGSQVPENIGVSEDGMWMIPVVRGWSSKSDQDAENYVVASNRATIVGGWNEAMLSEILEDAKQSGSISLTGYSEEDLDDLLTSSNGTGLDVGEGAEAPSDEQKAGSKGFLAQKFIAPPFTVLDTKSGYWQQRKRLWNDLGIKSEVGRKGDLVFGDGLNAIKTEAPSGGNASSARTSIFDPVLTEICYRWFCAPGGHVLDPFAGGSVRGIVASLTGRSYTGIDLSEQQVEENKVQAEQILDPEHTNPLWIADDSRDFLSKTKEEGFETHDFVFTCPPYYDLEVYSDSPKDLSNMTTYDDFLDAYYDIFSYCYNTLKDNSFAAVVVGDIRDKEGSYRGLVPDTIRAMQQAGFDFYNEAVILNALGSAAFRTKQFTSSRKLVKVHQNLLVFVKGDPKDATESLGDVTLDVQVAEETMSEEPEKGGEPDVWT